MAPLEFSSPLDCLRLRSLVGVFDIIYLRRRFFRHSSFLEPRSEGWPVMSMTREHLLVGSVVLSFAKDSPFRRHLAWPERYRSRISHVESLDEQEARAFMPSGEGIFSRP